MDDYEQSHELRILTIIDEVRAEAEAPYAIRVVRLKATLAEAQHKLEKVMAERNKARENYAYMVKHAADEKLDGYRELEHRAATTEIERNELRAWVAKQDCDERHDDTLCDDGACGLIPEADHPCTEYEARDNGCTDYTPQDCGRCQPCLERARKEGNCE